MATFDPPASITKMPARSRKVDRFIPTSVDSEGLGCDQLKDAEKLPQASRDYQSTLAAMLDDGQATKKRVLSFSGALGKRKLGEFEMELVTNLRSQKAPHPCSGRRYISENPERILDAPELIDDFYLNLLDWNQDNVLAVALGKTVYLWNASSGNIQELMQASGNDNYITSISWIQNGHFLAIGTQAAEVQLWDTKSLKQVRNMKGHRARVSSLSWNEYVLSSGSRDSYIFNHDVRIAQHHISTLEAHRQEVCGLTWSPDGTQLASGGNDNLLYIWDNRRQNPRFEFDHHQAAVKALAWSPHQRNLLASGGGTADRTIRFWNSSSGKLMNSVDAGSQVCQILWSTTEKELISSHGFSQNQLILWKYPSLCKQMELTGHTSRVLHMAMSPDGSTVVSAASDETLRFWRVFDATKKSSKHGTEPIDSMMSRCFTLR